MCGKIITGATCVACLFWGIILIIISFDKQAFIDEGKQRWKVILLAVVLLCIGFACILFG